MTSINPSARTRNALISSAIALFIFGACTKPTINFGTAFIDNNNTNIVVVDSFTTLMSTVYVDSFPTAQTGLLLVGRYKDDAFGTITSKTFYELAPPQNIPVISSNGGFDSLVLITRINKYFYGDTAISQRYHVSQLLNPIQYPGIQTTFYNNNTLPYNPVPMGTTDVTIYPQAGYTSQLARDSVKIRLPDATGQDLFVKLQTRDPVVVNIPSFLGYFKGLTMYPDDNSLGAVYGFQDTVIMRLFYHEPGVVKVQSFTDFRVYNRAFQFNNISADRTGTPVAKVVAVPKILPGIPVELSSDSTGNQAFVQSITSMQVKVLFPYIWKLQQLPDFVSILKADLIIKPVPGTYSPQLALPPRLELYSTDEKNLLGAPITFSGAQLGGLIVDYVYGQNTNYSYDVTNYMRVQLVAGATQNLKNGVMLVQPAQDYNTTFNRAILADRNNALNYRITLRIYYASFY